MRKMWKFISCVHSPSQLIFSLPRHSAISKSSFSFINAVKTDCGSKLGEDALANQLCIALHSPEIANFDFFTRPRLCRPNFMSKKTAKSCDPQSIQ